MYSKKVFFLVSVFTCFSTQAMQKRRSQSTGDISKAIDYSQSPFLHHARRTRSDDDIGRLEDGDFYKRRKRSSSTWRCTQEDKQACLFTCCVNFCYRLPALVRKFWS